MNIIMDRIKTLRLVEGDSVNISCRNGKTYEACIVKNLPKSYDEHSIQVEVLDKKNENHFLNILLAEIKIIRKIA
ncbi:MAG TPA: hypothetical protein VNB90_02825 [Cytophagaceae bacterium]|jgi:hypothetical protein|nr:hypothetical protein [Cytophagaceae bacterium]